MKMATWRQLVRATSDRIVDTDRRIERQRQLIQELTSDGLDTVLAEQALTVLIEAGRRLSEDRQRIIDSMPRSRSAQEPTASFRKASDGDMPSLERRA
jgi:hypothetical protein